MVHTQKEVQQVEKNNKKQGEQVLCLETGKIYSSTMEVQRKLGFSRGNISKVCNGKIKQAYGFHWQYVS